MNDIITIYVEGRSILATYTSIIEEGHEVRYMKDIITIYLC